MGRKLSHINLQELYLRLAEINSPAQVAREYGVNRSTINYWWNKLSEDERNLYRKQASETQNRILEQQKTVIEENTKSYIERLHDVKENLLEKLQLSITSIKPDENTAISRLKDATIVVQNLMTISAENDDAKEKNIYQKFTELSKLHERKS